MESVNRYLVELDSTEVDLTEGVLNLSSGVKLYLPPKQELDYTYIPKTAKVIGVPKTNYYDLKIGDIILINHFVNDNKISENIRWIEEYNPQNPTANWIYGVLDKSYNGLRMLKSNLIVERVEIKEQTSIEGFVFEGNSNKEDFLATVVHNFKNCPIPLGATISLFKDNFIPISLFGEKANMVDMNISVPFYWDKSNIVLLDDWVMIEAITENWGFLESKNNLYMPSKKHQDKNLGIIKKLPKSYNGELKVGMKVYFERNEKLMITIDDKDFYFANVGSRYDSIWFYFNK